jgi:hypothetical protein
MQYLKHMQYMFWSCRLHVSPAMSITPTTVTFGASALRVNNTIFAMLSSKGQFVVKLPRQRVEALIAAGAGRRHYRVVKRTSP